MDKQSEMNSLHEETFQLCKQWAYLRKIPMSEQMFENTGKFTVRGETYINRSAIQFCQAVEFHRFITALGESYFRLFEEPGRAEEVGREGLEKLHIFLKEYTRLLTEEQGWC